MRLIGLAGLAVQRLEHLAQRRMCEVDRGHEQVAVLGAERQPECFDLQR